MSAELKNTLLSSLPPGVSAQLAPDVVEHFGAVAATMQHGLDAVDLLAVNASPLTAGSERLRDWERYLGIADTRTALWGTLDARRAAVVSRLREYGTPTSAMIRAVLAPLLGYSDSSTLTLLEPTAQFQTTRPRIGSRYPTNPYVLRVRESAPQSFVRSSPP